MNFLNIFNRPRSEIINTDPESHFSPRHEIADTVYQIPVESIAPNPLQPRSQFDDEALFALARSIHEYGILQPLTVRCLGSEEAQPAIMYELIAGERRLRAAKLLKMPCVPCVITDADRKRSGEIAMIENLQREDLNFFEQAEAISRLIELFSLTQEKAAERLSVSQSYIANKLRLLKLGENERSVITAAGMTERHARSFLRISDPTVRKVVIRTVAEKCLNVAATEKYIESVLNPKKQETKGKRSIIIKDIRLFFNTVDKAVETVGQSGVKIESERTDHGDYIQLLMKIPKKK